MNRYENRTVFITGASRGIGKAIALRLGREGARVGIHYLLNEQEAERTAEEIRELGRHAVVFQGDVRNEASVKSMLVRAEAELGTLDVWVNNAGVEYEHPISEITEEQWDETFAVNVKGLFFCTRAVGEHMLARKRHEDPGAIVNISSRFGFLGDPGSLPYGASKGAVNNLTKAFAKLYAPVVRVNAVAPAFTPTDMMAHVSADYVEKFHRDTPLQRPAEPEDTANAVAFLASADAAFTTGQTLLVDGGYTLK